MLPRAGWADRALYRATLDEVRARLDEGGALPAPRRALWPYLAALATGLVIGGVSALFM